MEIGEDVVVRLGDQEVMGRVSRITPRGVEVRYELKLPAKALGHAAGLLTWRDGRETLVDTDSCTVVARITMKVDTNKTPAEQRAYTRLDRRLAVDVRLGTIDLASGSTRDLSTEGAKLKLNRGLKKGESVEVVLHLDEGPVTVGAQVLRQRKLSDGSHEAAVRFDLTHPEDKSRIVRFVFSRLKRR